MTNHYFEAIHADSQQDLLHHYHQFFQSEMEDISERLATIDADENPEQWSYEKGKLDSCRTTFGLVVQSRLTYDARQEDEEE